MALFGCFLAVHMGVGRAIIFLLTSTRVRIYFAIVLIRVRPLQRYMRWTITQNCLGGPSFSTQVDDN